MYYLYCKHRLRSVWHVLRCTCNHSKCSCMSDSAVHVLTFVLYISSMYVCMYVCMYGHHIYRSMNQPGKVTNPARGQLNRENNIPLSPCVPENLVSRDGFSRPVPRQPAHLHTQAESGAYLRDSSRVPRRRPYETAIRHRVSPEFIGSRNCVPMALTAESPPAQGQ